MAALEPINMQTIMPMRASSLLARTPPMVMTPQSASNHLLRLPPLNSAASRARVAEARAAHLAKPRKAGRQALLLWFHDNKDALKKEDESGTVKIWGNFGKMKNKWITADQGGKFFAGKRWIKAKWDRMTVEDKKPYFDKARAMKDEYWKKQAEENTATNKQGRTLIEHYEITKNKEPKIRQVPTLNTAQQAGVKKQSYVAKDKAERMRRKLGSR